MSHYINADWIEGADECCDDEIRSIIEQLIGDYRWDDEDPLDPEAIYDKCLDDFIMAGIKDYYEAFYFTRDIRSFEDKILIDAEELIEAHLDRY
jgi:hypothetical protein